MTKYLVGFEIVGHVSVEAANSQAAASFAIARVKAAADDLEQYGDVEYRAPCGGVVEVHPTKKRR